MIIGVIPARYGSTRFPAKVLADLNGKPLVQRVLERASKSSLDRVVVATDHEAVFQAVKNFGGDVHMTSADHKSGTDRCFEIATQLRLTAEDIIVNIQGDEPMIFPEQINELVDLMKREDAQIGTLLKKATDTAQVFNENVVKVVRGKNGEGLYFSRSAIPFQRDIPKEKWLEQQPYWLHVGMYAYNAKVLSEIANLQEGELEKAEKLEQLRWLENGYSILTAETTYHNYGVDTPEDLERLRKQFSENN